VEQGNYMGNHISMSSDWEKIGATVVKLFKKDGRWKFRNGNRTLDVAPADAMDLILSPAVKGVDSLVSACCKIKNIEEKNVLLICSEDYFPNADVKFNLEKPMGPGWIYKIEKLNLQGGLPGHKAWACSYLTMYFSEPPKSLYIRIEADDDSE